MTTGASIASRLNGTRGISRAWLSSSRNQAVVAFVGYLAISVGYFGVHVIPHLGRTCVCLPGGADPSFAMWSLAWWPHALLHGLNPFFSSAVFPPYGLGLGGETTAPGAAIVVAPLTLLFGPLVSYNALMLAAPVLAGFFAFLLCRYVTSNFAASLVGGYLFGFSAYMLGQLLGHPHLVLVFPVPAAVHLVLRLIDGRISRQWFIALMALSLAALVSLSTEVALTFTLLGALTLVVAFAFAPADRRRRLVVVVRPILAAGALAALVTSPVIYYGLKQNYAPPPGLDDVGGDALGFLVPTVLFRFGRQYFAAVSAPFTNGDPAESGIYIGLPLALIVARYAITRWRFTSTRILVAILAVVVVLLLGSHLHIAGHATIPLPWKLLNRSLLRNAVPARLGLYMFLIVAMIAAMWLAQARRGNWRIAKWALVAASIVFLVPNIGSGQWRLSPPNPRFFTTHQYRAYLRRGENVLVLPYGFTGFSMLWQAETGMWFRMTGGVAKGTPAGYITDPLTPALFGEVQPNPQYLRSFLERRHVGAVIVEPSQAGAWPQALASIDLRPLSLGGVWFYPVSPLSST